MCFYLAYVNINLIVVRTLSYPKLIKKFSSNFFEVFYIKSLAISMWLVAKEELVFLRENVTGGDEKNMQK